MNEIGDGKSPVEWKPNLADKFWIGEGLCDRYGHVIESGKYEITNALDELLEIVSLLPHVFSIEVLEKAKRYVVVYDALIDAYNRGVVYQRETPSL